MSQDDLEHGDDVNQRRESKRRGRFGTKVKIVGGVQRPPKHPCADSVGEAELGPNRETEARDSDLGICPAAHSWITFEAQGKGDDTKLGASWHGAGLDAMCQGRGQWLLEECRAPPGGRAPGWALGPHTKRWGRLS